MRSLAEKRAHGGNVGAVEIKAIFDTISEKADELEQHEIAGAYSPTGTETLCLTVDNNLAFYDSKQ